MPCRSLRRLPCLGAHPRQVPIKEGVQGMTHIRILLELVQGCWIATASDDIGALTVVRSDTRDGAISKLQQRLPDLVDGDYKSEVVNLQESAE